MTKLFQHNHYSWDDRINKHYQFLIFRGKSLLHLMYEKETPCPYTGIHIWVSLLDPNCLFSVEFAIKGYALSFYVFSEYWKD
jgi:hypothetical protein